MARVTVKGLWKRYGDTVVLDRPINPKTGTPFSRNAFRGPRQTTFDLSLAKDFALKMESGRLELRADQGSNRCNGRRKVHIWCCKCALRCSMSAWEEIFRDLYPHFPDKT